MRVYPKSLELVVVGYGESTVAAMSSTIARIIGGVPYLLGDAAPFVRELFALRAKLLGALLGGQIGTGRARTTHHGRQTFGIFQHRTRPQEVVVERLALVVLHEQGRLQRFKKGRLVDVGIGIVDKHAGFHVTSRVDVEITATSRYATSNELAIVLEIEDEQGFLASHLPNGVTQPKPLLHRRHESRVRV